MARTVGLILKIETKVPDKGPSLSLQSLDAEQLKAYAAEHDIDIGQSSSVKGIIKKIKEAEENSK